MMKTGTTNACSVEHFISPRKIGLLLVGKKPTAPFTIHATRSRSYKSTTGAAISSPNSRVLSNSADGVETKSILSG